MHYLRFLTKKKSNLRKKFRISVNLTFDENALDYHFECVDQSFNRFQPTQIRHQMVL